MAREWETHQIKTAQKPRLGAERAPNNHPDAAVVKTDAAWKADLKLAGLGWTITDRSRTRSFSTLAFFVGSPLAAEGLALREAILKCKEIGYTQIACESDSTQLIQAVNSVSIASELYGIVADIVSVASSFDAFSLRWISRRNNAMADCLAKQILADEIVFNVPPNNV